VKRVRVYQNTTLKVGENVFLDKNNQKYLKKVLRLKNGFQLVIFNGDGFDYQAELQNDELQVLSLTKNGNELNTKITLVQGIAKNDKMDFIIQKAVELGVMKIIPIITERTVVKLDEKKKINRQAHWQKIAISATEQCGRSIVPEVVLPISLNEYIQNNKISGFVLHHRGDKTLLDYKVEKEINVLIGPEGGLSGIEIQEAIQNNHQALLLGKTVLRTETAGLCALSQLALLWC
jgi:16S rRNA (uracil1498-N3)-methyltransferase